MSSEQHEESSPARKQSVSSTTSRKQPGMLGSLMSSLSFRGVSMERHVAHFLDPDCTAAEQKRAMHGIRTLAEKNKNVQEIISAGAIPVLVSALQDTVQPDFPLWSLWVLRFLAETSPVATGLVLQEPMAIESLIGLVNGAYVGSELAKWSVETMEQLSTHEMTLTLMAREDLFKCLTSALLAAPPEATAALRTLINLSEMKTGAVPHYLPMLASDRTMTNLDKFAAAAPGERQALVDKLKQHLSKARTAVAPQLGEATVIKEEEGE